MQRLLVPFALALGLVALAPGRADACSMAFVDYFTRFDDTPTVARVQVTAVEATGAVALRRIKTLKGAAKGTLTGQQGGMCPPTYEKGMDVIAFVDANGVASWIEGNPKTTIAVLAKWKAAKTVAAKRVLLGKLVKSKDEAIKMHAEEKLRLLNPRQ
jgi:hypothetical protein